jgi:hypothetical protein
VRPLALRPASPRVAFVGEPSPGLPVHLRYRRATTCLESGRARCTNVLIAPVMSARSERTRKVIVGAPSAATRASSRPHATASSHTGPIRQAPLSSSLTPPVSRTALFQAIQPRSKAAPMDSLNHGDDAPADRWLAGPGSPNEITRVRRWLTPQGGVHQGLDSDIGHGKPL